jgi:response regulator of citrate/malate metabolism
LRSPPLPTSSNETISKYRDRADERRKDKNEDPQDEIAALAGVDIEMSKYLGGDAEHTHLVKGLDYALLNKVRGEMMDPRGQSAANEDGKRLEIKKTAKVIDPLLFLVFLQRGEGGTVRVA